MSWAALIQALASAIGQVFGFLDRKQIKDGGKAEAKAEGYEKAHKARVDGERAADDLDRLHSRWNRDK